MRNRIAVSWLAGILLIALSGCSDGGSSSSNGNSVDTPVNSADGKAAVVVPAGSAIAASKVTVAPTVPASVPASTGLVPGTAYDFGPAGTVFAKPATVSLKYDPTKLPAGAVENSLQVFTVSSGKWTQVPGSSVDTTKKVVSAPVSHFSTYGILSPNTYSGTFSGHYSGTGAGTFQMVLLQTGAIAVTGTDAVVGPFAGSGTVSLTGSAAVGANGSGTINSGATFTFTGAFVKTGTTDTATGTWTASAPGVSGTATGTWSIP